MEFFVGRVCRGEGGITRGQGLAVVEHSSATNAMWDPNIDRKLEFQLEITVRMCCMSELSFLLCQRGEILEYEFDKKDI